MLILIHVVKRYLVNSYEFIKNITKKANQIQKNGLQINGNLIIIIIIKATCKISNNQNSLSDNKKIISLNNHI
jgi:hypothetical protein